MCYRIMMMIMTPLFSIRARRNGRKRLPTVDSERWSSAKSKRGAEEERTDNGRQDGLSRERQFLRMNYALFQLYTLHALEEIGLSSLYHLPFNITWY